MLIALSADSDLEWTSTSRSSDESGLALPIQSGRPLRPAGGSLQEGLDPLGLVPDDRIRALQERRQANATQAGGGSRAGGSELPAGEVRAKGGEEGFGDGPLDQVVLPATGPD